MGGRCAPHRRTPLATATHRERYEYDAAGTMVKSLNTVTGAWTVYAGLYEKTGAGSVTKYYNAGGSTFAVRTNGVLAFVLTDHLGGTSKVLDQNGTVVSSQRYWPYGATRSTSGTTPTELLYTGQREEAGDPAGLGLYNYKARFYSTVLGRFVSVDPIVASVDDPQAWNPYTYVRNNPTRLIDPTGMRYDDGVTPNTINPIHKPRSGCADLCKALLALSALGLDSPAKIAAAQAHSDFIGAMLYLAAQAPNALPAAGGCYCEWEPYPGGWGGQYWENAKRNWTEWGSWAYGNSIGVLFSDDTAPNIDRPESLEGLTPEEVRELIPEGWVEGPSRVGGGKVYANPARPGEQVRVMPGNPRDSNPVKRGPYVRVSTSAGPTGGQRSEPIPLAGNPTLPPQPEPLPTVPP